MLFVFGLLVCSGCAPTLVLRADIDTVTAEYLPSEQQVEVAVTGVFASRCGSGVGRDYSVTQSRDRDTFDIAIFYTYAADRACLPTTREFEDVVYFEAVDLPKGSYAVRVNDFRVTFDVIENRVRVVWIQAT